MKRRIQICSPVLFSLFVISENTFVVRCLCVSKTKDFFLVSNALMNVTDSLHDHPLENTLQTSGEDHWSKHLQLSHTILVATLVIIFVLVLSPRFLKKSPVAKVTLVDKDEMRSMRLKLLGKVEREANRGNKLVDLNFLKPYVNPGPGTGVLSEIFHKTSAEISEFLTAILGSDRATPVKIMGMVVALEDIVENILKVENFFNSKNRRKFLSLKRSSSKFRETLLAPNPYRVLKLLTEVMGYVPIDSDTFTLKEDPFYSLSSFLRLIVLRLSLQQFTLNLRAAGGVSRAKDVPSVVPKTSDLLWLVSGGIFPQEILSTPFSFLPYRKKIFTVFYDFRKLAA